jgi:hypothetical protein
MTVEEVPLTGLSFFLGTRRGAGGDLPPPRRRAPVVGARMAGLLGGTCGYTLPHSGIVCRFPCEKVFHVNGTPRADWLPEVLVDLAEAADGDAAWRQSAAESDPILAAGQEVLDMEPVAPR